MTTVYYCDPMQSSQKPHVENNHNFIRDILPNERDLHGLTQNDINLMFSHINSYLRKVLNRKTPYYAFDCLFGKGMIEKLAVQSLLEFIDKNINKTIHKLSKNVKSM